MWQWIERAFFGDDEPNGRNNDDDSDSDSDAISSGGCFGSKGDDTARISGGGIAPSSSSSSTGDGGIVRSRRRWITAKDMHTLDARIAECGGQLRDAEAALVTVTAQNQRLREEVEAVLMESFDCDEERHPDGRGQRATHTTTTTTDGVHACSPNSQKVWAARGAIAGQLSLLLDGLDSRRDALESRAYHVEIQLQMLRTQRRHILDAAMASSPSPSPPLYSAGTGSGSNNGNSNSNAHAAPGPGGYDRLFGNPEAVDRSGEPDVLPPEAVAITFTEEPAL